MAIWELGHEVFEVAVHPHGLSHLGNDPEGERVAPDASDVLAEQVGGSLGVAGCRGADNLDVVAFPVHLPTTAALASGSGNGVEVGEGEFERRVGFDGEAQRCDGPPAVDGSLRLPVPRRRPRACGDRAAVVLNSGPGGVRVIMSAERLTLWWLHESQSAWLA
jgi:hypothetical protein